MATQYSLTNAFTAITEESGTIQNIGYESVELVSTTNAVAGEGIILLPGEKKVFTGAVKARSLGAENTINVVDFKAGEGGGDDVMAGASASADGKSGLVPTPTAGNENRFLRGDGTWAVPTDEDTQYQPATTLTDGLMSSTDKTFVEEEKESYRQPSTTYAAGQIAYHSTLPTGWYLECTAAGTTSAGEITPSSTIKVGETVSDGTVVWTVMKNLPLLGGIILGPICSNSQNKKLVLKAGNATDGTEGAILELFEKEFPDTPTVSGSFNAYARNDSQTSYLRLFPSGKLALKKHGVSGDNDLSGSAIVAKSLGANGYVKYASGLIVQWGQANIYENITNLGNCFCSSFPISFGTSYSIIGCTANNSDLLTNDYFFTATMIADISTKSKVYFKKANNAGGFSTSGSVHWLAIGY